MSNFGTVLLVAVIYAAALVCYCCVRKTSLGPVIYKNAIVLYTMVLLMFKFLPETGESVVRLIPLQKLFQNGEVGFYAIELLLSVLLFVPMGFLSGMQSLLKGEKSAFLKAVLLGALLSLIAELFQLFPLGKVAATDHLLCNTVGAALGFVVFALLSRTDRMQRALKSILYP